jgi:uncharacterized membrane protein YwzB
MWHARMMHLSMALALLVSGFVLDNTDASLMHHVTYVDGFVVRS